MMRKWFIIPVLLIFVLLSYSSALAGGVKQLREENQALKSQLNSAVSRISHTESQIDDLQTQLGIKDQELKEMRADLDTVEIKLEELEELLRTEGSELLQEVMDLREKKVSLEEQIEKLERDIVITNKQVEQLDLLVKNYRTQLQERGDEISVLEKNVDNLSRSLNAQSEDYKKQIDRLNVDKQKLEEEISRLERTVEALEGTLTEQSNSTSKQIADLTTRNEKLQGEINVLKNDLDTLQNTFNLKEAEFAKRLTVLSSEKENLESQVTQLQEKNNGLQKQIVDLQKEGKATLASEEANRERMKKTYDQLVASLRKEVGEKTIEVQSYENALTINIMEKIFFDSGKAVIKPAGLDVLRRVGAIIKDLREKIIRIEGHTDDVPIGPKLVSVYPNNWELGAARASNVAEYFRTKSGISPERLVVVSYSMYKPIVPNTSDENRARNRRIEIILQDTSYYEMIRAVEGERS